MDVDAPGVAVPAETPAAARVGVSIRVTVGDTEAGVGDVASLVEVALGAGRSGVTVGMGAMSPVAGLGLAATGGLPGAVGIGVAGTGVGDGGGVLVGGSWVAVGHGDATVAVAVGDTVGVAEGVVSPDGTAITGAGVNTAPGKGLVLRGVLVGVGVGSGSRTGLSQLTHGAALPAPRVERGNGSVSASTKRIARQRRRINGALLTS